MKKNHERELYDSNVEVLSSLIPAMVDWAEERDEFSKTLQAIGAMAFDMGAPRFDPKWYVESRTEYIVSKITTEGALLAEFQKEVGPRLHARQQALLKVLNQHPAYWIFYELPKGSKPLFTTCKVTLDPSKTIVIRHLEQDVSEVSWFPHRLALVFNNGSFIQTSGFQHHYAAVDNKSMLFYLTGLYNGEPISLNSASMTRCINRYYNEVILLDSIAFEDDTILGYDTIEVFWGTCPLPSEFVPRNILGRWRYSRRGKFLCMVYDQPDKVLLQQEVPSHLSDRMAKGYGKNWKFPEYFVLALFIDLEARQLGAYANTKKAWQLLCHLLTSEISARDIRGSQDYSQVSFPVLAVTAQLEGFQYPWSSWEPLFTPLAQEVLEEPIEISKSRAVLHEYLDNEDPRFNLDARCFRMDVNPLLITELAHAIEVIDAMEDSERGSFSLTSIPGDFELHNFTPLLEEELPDLTLFLEESVLFYLDVRNAYPLFASYTHGMFADIGQASDLVKIIDDMFYELYIIDDFPHPVVMNYLFLLFFHTGDQWTSVRTYVIELLKLLYAFIEPGGEETEADLLAAQLSQFIYDQLCHSALVEVKVEPSAEQLIWGTYLIRPTDLFFTLVHRR